MVPYRLYSTILITLTLGIANSIPYSMVACYAYQMVFFNTIFFIVCKYFNIKINTLNESLEVINVKPLLCKQVRPILRSLIRLYREISVYNMFWSKYLFTIWLILGISLVLFLFMITFVSLILIIKLIIIYFTIMGTISLLGTYSLLSFVNYHANKTYEILNSLFVNKLSKTKKNERLLLYYKVKCNSSTIQLYFLLFKVNIFIERIAKKIGFTCWQIFIINYHRFYEVHYRELTYLFLNVFFNLILFFDPDSQSFGNILFENY